jgi:energy-coupling factor transporter ATP-binding protein EcfA2
MELSKTQIEELKKLLEKVRGNRDTTQITAEEDRKTALELNKEAIRMDATAIESRAAANESESLANKSDAIANTSRAVANDCKKTYAVKLLLMKNLGINLDEASEDEQRALLKELGIDENEEC